ncbi:MAG: NAD(P)-binding protein [Bacteroidetes bacterium]|nr:NAD(P)-binding protein [Bacteroidota bacterium]
MEHQKLPDHLDVVIVGAGLSGIAAAYHIQDKCPGKTFAVLEGRAAMGGTWDLFRYPGIRSDSDMYTLGFSFNPWPNPKTIADGPSILCYIKDTASKFGLDQHIHYNTRVAEAAWSDADARWTLTLAAQGDMPERRISAGFLFMCSGYYHYQEAYQPVFPGSETFAGRMLHPQHWTDDVAYEGKKVVVIGSGATAVTLVPELAKKAQQVTMLQRSPTYIMTLPSEDRVANFLKQVLPDQTAHNLVRWKNILLNLAFYKVSKRWPQTIRRFIQKGIQKELGSSYEQRHFDPAYDPWDQRLCLVPDGDLFHALKSGKAQVVTDTIRTFTERGIQLSSGQELEADLIVTATGLKIQLLGGMAVRVNGELLDSGNMHCYKGVLFGGVPNFAVAIGYTNASWTLKCDLNCLFVARLLNHMDRKGYRVCTPQYDQAQFGSEPLLDFDAGYIKRALDVLPRQGSRKPWKVYQNYLRDTLALRYGSVRDAYLVYR